MLLAVLLCASAAAAVGPPRFDVDGALRTIRHLSVAIGIRHEGTAAEATAASYLASQLREAGYRTVSRIEFRLPDGATSQDVAADKPGSTDRIIVVGAHMDSRGEAPGANDNASGCAVVLAVSRAMRGMPTRHTLRFMFFGAEEILDPALPDGHHFGSRYYVSHLPASERRRVVGMICVDAVAAGGMYVIGNMRGGSPLAARMRHEARRLGLDPLDQTDPGWSDHEPFEKAGIPVAYVRWRIDPHLHTRYDVMRFVSPSHVAAAGRTVLATCLDL